MAATNNKGKNSRKHNFLEWLSDYLRYFVLLIAVILAIAAIVLGFRIYSNVQGGSDGTGSGGKEAIVILDETKGESQAAAQSESTRQENATENNTISAGAKGQTDSETDKGSVLNDQQGKIKTTETAQTQKEETKPSGTAASGKETTKETTGQETTQAGTSVIEVKQTETKQTETKQTETRQTETKAPETDPPQTEPPKPVYLTMTGTCYIRSYADYGDNIIGEYPAGTVVEFLEDVGGWYKVQVDGMVGYMGARFFN